MTEESIFIGALESKTPEERAAYLDSACGADAELRQRIEALLASDEKAGPFLAAPTLALDSAEPAEALGTWVGPYRLLEQIGEGAMGIVYLAEQEQPIRRKVAVKIIKPGMDSRQIVARFQAERQTLALMNHPNIAAVFDAGMTAGHRPYFVMELVTGAPITQYCDLNRLTPRQRLELFIPVCQAIQHAHQKGIIHRDIKPSNVLVAKYDDRAVPKVIDFGVAKAIGQPLTEATQFTSFGAVIGTLQYMSPEQATFNALDVDTRSDIYALGAVLYELLTGSPPLKEQLTQNAAVDKLLGVIRDVEPARPSTRLSSLGAAGTAVAAARRAGLDALASQLRSELEWIPMKAMRKERDRRYASPLEMAEDIANYLQNRPLRAGPESIFYRLRKTVGRNRPAVATAAGFILLLTAALAIYIHAIRQARNDLLAEQDKTLKALADATQQAAIAKAVSSFQADMLLSADPDQLLGDKVTVVQAMQGAIRSLDAGEVTNPAAEVAVRNVIGKILTSLGRSAEAEPVLRRALQIHKERLPADKDALETTLNNLGVALMDQDNAATLKEAEADFRSALALCRQQPGTTDLNSLLNNLGELLQTQRKLPEAKELFEEALRLQRSNSSAQDPVALANTTNNLATLLLEQNNPKEAESLLRQTLAMQRSALPAGHPGIIYALNNLGTLLRMRHRLDEAEKLLTEALKSAKEAFPSGHPIIATIDGNLGLVYQDQNRWSEAIPLFRDALAIDRKARRQGHPEIAKALNNLANALHVQGSQEEAESLYQEALGIQLQALPANHPDLAVTLNNLGNLLQSRDRPDEAEPLLLEALRIRRQVLGADDPDLARSLFNLGALRMNQRKPDYPEAEKLLRQSLEILQKSLPDDHPDLASNLMMLGTALKMQGKLSEAELTVRKAVAASRKAFKPDQPELAMALNNLANILIEENDEQKIAEATPLLREALAICRKAMKPDDRRFLLTLDNLGRSYYAQGKYDDALPLMRESMTLFRKTLPPDDLDLATSAKDLGVVLMKKDNPEEAQPLFREALRIYETKFPANAPVIQLTASLLTRALEANHHSDEAARIRQTYGLTNTPTTSTAP